MRFVLSFLLCLSLAACSKEQEAPSAVESSSMPTAAAEQLARTSSVSCADDQNCAPNVGMLVGLKRVGENSSAYACSFALVGPSLALTNAHCLPPELRHAGAACKDRIWLHLPQAPALNCKTVSASTDGAAPRGSISSDLALLELEAPAAATAIPLARGDFAGIDSLKLIKVDYRLGPTPEGFRGVQSSASCRLARENIYLPFSDQGPILTLGACTAQAGNSGSPLLDGEGRLRALLQDLRIVENEEFQARQLLRGMLRLADEAPAPRLLFATKLDGLSLTPAAIAPANSAALENPFRRALIPAPDREEQLQNEIARFLTPWLDAHHTMADWKIVEAQKESLLVRSFTALPLCKRSAEAPDMVPAVVIDPSLDSLFSLDYRVRPAAVNHTIDADSWAALPSCAE